MKALKRLLKRLDRLACVAEALLPPAPPRSDSAAIAWRWRYFHEQGYLEPVARPHRVRLDDLACIDPQKAELVRNTRQLLAGRGANHVLLSGSRGTGKSSLIKALLNEFHPQGLRLIQVDKEHLGDLNQIVDQLTRRKQCFILYCDDLSFEADDPAYKSLKAVLDGSIVAPADNLLIYATSNRRHLLPEYLQENLQAQVVDGEIHHSEAVEEKISLSERFGLCLSFHPFNQDQYLHIVDLWLQRLGADLARREAAPPYALRWALARGSRSGRVAWQFARDWSGRETLPDD